MTDSEKRVIVQAVHGELGAAMVQMIDSDDKIICDHVREAHRMLSELLYSSDRQTPQEVLDRLLSKVSPARQRVADNQTEKVYEEEK